MGEGQKERTLPITSEEIEIYQKLSQFCPLKIDLAELKSTITTMSHTVNAIGGKMDNLEKVMIEYKVMETEFGHFKRTVEKIEKDLGKEKEDSVTKRDMMVYLTIGSLIVIILSAIIGAGLAKLI